MKRRRPSYIVSAYKSNMTRAQKRRATASYMSAVKRRRRTRYNNSRLMKEEVKNLDTTLTSEFAVAGYIHPCSDVQIGTAYNQRIGSRITMLGIEIKAEIAYASADNSNFVQYKLIRWKDKGTPAIGDIVSDTTHPYVSFTSINSTDKIETLRTGMIALNDQRPTTSLHLYVDLKGKMAKWLAGTNTRDYGQLYLLLVSDSTAAPSPATILKTRLRYVG